MVYAILNLAYSKEYMYYKLKPLEWNKGMNLVLGLIQENLIENSIQNCLPFIV